MLEALQHIFVIARVNCPYGAVTAPGASCAGHESDLSDVGFFKIKIEHIPNGKMLRIVRNMQPPEDAFRIQNSHITSPIFRNWCTVNISLAITVPQAAIVLYFDYIIDNICETTSAKHYK